MLAKRHRLCQEAEFNQIFKKGLFLETDLLIMRMIKTQADITRFGFVVAKKISKKAVTRNLIKRRISEAIRICLPQIKPGYDLVIIAKPETRNSDFKNILKATRGLLGEAKIMDVKEGKREQTLFSRKRLKSP